MKRILVVLFAVLSLGGVFVSAHAQDAPRPPGRPPGAAPGAAMLRVFLDCQDCDDDYIRQNVPFVDYVRDRAVADLHVLVTTERTGGGGLSWVLKFIGLDHLQGQDRSLAFATDQTATQDERRKEFARVFKLGLVGYAAATSVAPTLDVTWTKPGPAGSAAPKKDPWNYWTFRVGFNGNLNGEQSSNSKDYSSSLSANRTTDKWKVQISGNGSTRKNSFTIDADTTVKTATHSWNINGLVVKSLGPHWGIGGTTSASHSSFSNTEHSFSVTPGVEYDFFPYSDSARRLFTVQYTAGIVHNQYGQITIFDKLSETVPKQFVSSALSLRQPWGSLNVSSSFSQQLNHLGRYRASVFGQADVRLFKGFSFNVFAEYDKISDQISLQRDALSEAEVLLRVQQLATGYSYFASFGFSYSFGSIFNSIVNPRFGSGGMFF